MVRTEVRKQKRKEKKWADEQVKNPRMMKNGKRMIKNGTNFFLKKKEKKKIRRI